MNNNDKPVLAIIGGTGNLGTGLALRWLAAGYKVIIGSRSEEKAQQAVNELIDQLDDSSVAEQASAMDNAAAAAACDIATLTVPFGHHQSTLEVIKEGLNGKILIDVTVPLKPPKVARVQLPEAGSAAVMAQQFLGESVQVVSAFQNVAAHHLQGGHGLDCDVLVCGDKKTAREEVIKLVEAAGMRGFHAGSIYNSAATEAMTSLLIFINKQYQCHAGIKITGLNQD